jgi:predicted amidophosphoribosyltransferase
MSTLFWAIVFVAAGVIGVAAWFAWVSLRPRQCSRCGENRAEVGPYCWECTKEVNPMSDFVELEEDMEEEDEPAYTR